MSEASDLFWKLTRQYPVPRPGNQDALRDFMAAASLWRSDGKYLSAAFAMCRAIMAAWGTDSIHSCVDLTLEDFEKCVETQPASSHEGLVALVKWVHELQFESPPGHVAETRRALLEELAQRLVTHHGSSSHAENYLVTGFQVRSDLNGEWEPIFPTFEVEWGVEQGSHDSITINLPSAFRVFVSLGDYQGAYAVIERCPNAFSTPGLRGWKAAVRGFINPNEAVERFEEAADAFAEDQAPSDKELLQRGSWSSTNIDLWSKYFRSRSFLAMIVRHPSNIRDLIRKAAEALEGTESGWVNSKVSRFRILVQALDQLMDENSILTLGQARDQFVKEAAWSGDDAGDTIALQFLSLAAEAFDCFKSDPVREYTSGRLPEALKALARIPLIGPDIAGALTYPVGTRAHQVVLGPYSTWIHRTLEGISNESHLRKIVLRLLEASIPIYAQILHGPIEYGKDIVALFEKGAQRILNMYQIKCGEINTRVWRTSCSELEEMYLIPLPKMQISSNVDFREGILLCNSHANPYVIPVMEGWFADQKRAHGRHFRFMNLDDLVRWIMNERLINEFRAALLELGIPVS